MKDKNIITRSIVTICLLEDMKVNQLGCTVAFSLCEFLQDPKLVGYVFGVGES